MPDGRSPSTSGRRGAARVTRSPKALEGLEGETATIEFVKIDIDENPVVASRYDVLSIPTVILFSEGAPAETVIGARSAEHFRRTFEPYR